MPLVADYDEMASVVDCYAKPSVPTAGGVRLGVLTISGGQAALAADLAERNGVAIAEISEATTTKLSEIIDGLPGQNPLDIAVDPKAQDYSGPVHRCDGGRSQRGHGGGHLRRSDQRRRW